LILVGKRQTKLDGQSISYTIKRSARAKHIRLEVRRETGLTVVVPRSYPLHQLTDLLEEKKRWILGKLAQCGQAPLLSREKELKSGDTLPYLGRELEVVVRENPKNADSIELVQHRLVVSPRLSTDGRLGFLLEQWYRAQAAKLIAERVDELSARLGVTCNRLTIRGQRTRWGSCSHKGTLSFNWKVIMAPQPVIDYVVIHELAHRKEMNHTKRFWGLVAEYCPRWRQHRRWLKEHEAELAAKLSP